MNPGAPKSCDLNPGSTLTPLQLYGSLTFQGTLCLLIISHGSSNHHIYSWSLENIPCQCSLFLRSPSSPTLLFHRQAMWLQLSPAQEAKICGTSCTWILYCTYSGFKQNQPPMTSFQALWAVVHSFQPQPQVSVVLQQIQFVASSASRRLPWGKSNSHVPGTHVFIHGQLSQWN